VSAEKFLGEKRAKGKPRPRNSSNKPSILLVARKKGTLGMHPGLTSRECCTKEPCVKMKTFLWRNSQFWKNAYLYRKLQHNFV